MKQNKWLALILSCCLLASLAACNNNGGDSTGDAPMKVGIIQMMEHEALSAAREGFIAALADKGLKDGEQIIIEYKDGNGDSNNMGTIAEQFVADKKDLILAIATPAAQAVAAKTEDIPILATAITSFTEANLVNSDEVPGGNVSGTSDMNPIAEQIDLIFELTPDVKTVGFLYNSSEDNSRLQVAMAKEVLDSKGISYVERTVSNQSEVQQAAQSIIGECDAIYLPTDNVFASTMPQVHEIAVAHKVPVYCAENNMVLSGGFAALGLTYYDLGYQAGLMAYEILVNDADISTMPVTGASNFEYCISGEFADALGITIPEKYAEFVVDPE